MDPIYISNYKKPSYEMKRRETKLDKEWPRMASVLSKSFRASKIGLFSPYQSSFTRSRRRLLLKRLSTT